MWFVLTAFVINPVTGDHINVKDIDLSPPLDVPLVYEIQANSQVACHVAASEQIHDWMRRYGINWVFEVKCEKEESI